MATKPSAKKPPVKPQRPARAPASSATAASVEAFLANIDDKSRDDCRKLDAWMHAATGSQGVMYGKSIVGYGRSTIRYADGREAPWMKIGFAARSQALTLYGLLESAPASGLLGKLGKHSTGKSCLYIKRLSDISEETLLALIAAAAK